MYIVHTQNTVAASKKFIIECKARQEPPDECRLAGKYKEEVTLYWSA